MIRIKMSLIKIKNNFIEIKLFKIHFDIEPDDPVKVR